MLSSPFYVCMELINANSKIMSRKNPDTYILLLAFRACQNSHLESKHENNHLHKSESNHNSNLKEQVL